MSLFVLYIYRKYSISYYLSPSLLYLVSIYILGSNSYLYLCHIYNIYHIYIIYIYIDSFISNLGLSLTTISCILSYLSIVYTL
jgi:hypothetical protein